MMLRREFVVVTIAALMGSVGCRPLSAATWRPVACGDATQKEAARFAAAVRAARPGEELYVPRPFPLTAEDVFDDFAAQYLDLRSERSVGEVRPWEAELFAGLRASGRVALRPEVLQVANWHENGCKPVGRIAIAEFVWLLRLFDVKTGDEVLRATLNPSGLLDTFIFPKRKGGWRDDGEARLPDSADARASAQRFGLGPARDLQYVTLYGPRVGCPEDRPCLAFRAQGRTFLFERGTTYELAVDGEKFRGKDLVFGGPKRQAILAKLKGKQSLVPVGGEELIVATPLE